MELECAQARTCCRCQHRCVIGLQHYLPTTHDVPLTLPRLAGARADRITAMFFSGRTHTLVRQAAATHYRDTQQKHAGNLHANACTHNHRH
jgi:hypothetical protein